ncbi:MAG: hypothetical protein GY757_09995 [bacterium]|nr:hypothetical protein [bacterium]
MTKIITPVMGILEDIEPHIKLFAEAFRARNEIVEIEEKKPGLTAAVESLQIKTLDDLEKGAELSFELRDAITKIEALTAPFTIAANSLHKATTRLRGQLCSSLKGLQTELKGKVDEFQRAEAARRAEEQKQREAAAAEEQKRLEAKALEQAAALEDTNPDEAEKIMNTQIHVPVIQPQKIKKVTSPGGTLSFGDDIEVRLTDVKKLTAAVGSGNVPDFFISVDMRKLKRFCKDYKITEQQAAEFGVSIEPAYKQTHRKAS